MSNPARPVAPSAPSAGSPKNGRSFLGEACRCQRRVDASGLRGVASKLQSLGAHACALKPARPRMSYGIASRPARARCRGFNLFCVCLRTHLGFGTGCWVCRARFHCARVCHCQCRPARTARKRLPRACNWACSQSGRLRPRHAPPPEWLAGRPPLGSQQAQCLAPCRRPGPQPNLPGSMLAPVAGPRLFFDQGLNDSGAWGLPCPEGRRRPMPFTLLARRQVAIASHAARQSRLMLPRAYTNASTADALRLEVRWRTRGLRPSAEHAESFVLQSRRRILASCRGARNGPIASSHRPLSKSRTRRASATPPL